MSNSGGSRKNAGGSVMSCELQLANTFTRQQCMKRTAMPREILHDPAVTSPAGRKEKRH
jgi:hypothetical protein